jgi:hypothetical protein
VTELRLESYQNALKFAKRGAVQSLVMTSIIVFIDVVVFAAHWRVVKRYADSSAIA